MNGYGLEQWQAIYAEVAEEHDRAMEVEETTGREPDPSYWQDRDEILVDLAHDAATLIEELSAQLLDVRCKVAGLAAEADRIVKRSEVK